jgi:hypothetical protein
VRTVPAEPSNPIVEVSVRHIRNKNALAGREG